MLMIKLLKECAEYIRSHPDNGLSEKYRHQNENYQ